MQKKPDVKIALPRDRNNIRKIAFRIRSQLRLGSDTNVDIVSVLELMVPLVDQEFALIPLEDKELPGRYAETRPEEHTIYVKQSVYEAAARGGGWARMILAHEVGHYVLHDSQSVVYAKIDPSERLNPDTDPERQADIFAAEFLAPSGAIKRLTPDEVKRQFGVSLSAARNQLHQASNISRRQARKRKKRSNQKA